MSFLYITPSAGARRLGHLAALGALVLLVAACGSVTSSTVIDAGQTFVLDGSGERVQGFSVDLRNSGREAVEVVEAGPGGRMGAPTVVAPGERARASVGPGASLRVRNREGRQARVDLVLTGNTNVGMGYAAPDSARG